MPCPLLLRPLQKEYGFRRDSNKYRNPPDISGGKERGGTPTLQLRGFGGPYTAFGTHQRCQRYRKEYVAHRIHQLSKRADKPFVAIDCGAMLKELAASEFFGHVKGSFTGAVADKTGAFVEANGGTLFLDEVGNLSYDVQVQLLRAIQERKIRPVGSNQEIEVDVRLVCATNENLQQAIARGEFREDLYHRLNEFTLHMPSLKDRGEDILLFANFFLDQANKELERHIVGFDAPASEALLNYAWPGNLRELKTG